MSSDDRKTPAPPPKPLAPADTVAATDVLSLVHVSPPAFAEPATLVEGLRYLQQLIPGFTHLSVEEKRTHSRAANLDPEFIEAGLHAATVWRFTEVFVKRSAAELRQEQEEIRRWDQVIVEMRAITDGIESANTKRKHGLGSAILMIYRQLGVYASQGFERETYMRPYYENMKRAYLRTGRFRRKKTTKPEEPETE
jgi:hypothetical protein